MGNIQYETNHIFTWFLSFPGVTCSVEVMIKRQSRYTGKSGQVATIECPVKYCHEKPSMSWCKVEGNDCLPLQTRETYTKWTEDTIFVLTFSSVHRNDSGLYRCQAISGNISSVSHSVNVTILGKFLRLLYCEGLLFIQIDLKYKTFALVDHFFLQACYSVV